jgi:MYXO-CTERM domain-containing protein
MFVGAVPGVALANDWTQLGLDGARARASGEVSGAPFAPAWRATVSNGPIVSSPIAADGYVVVAGSRGALAALHAFDGRLAWSSTAVGALGASPAVDHGRVFVPTLTGRLQALSLSDGHQLWQRAFGGQNYGSPAITGGSLVLAAGFPAQGVARVNAATGATEWQTADGAVADLVNSSPAIAGSQVLFGMNGGRYQSLDLATGATGWHADTTGSVGLSAPLVVGDVAYFLPGGKTAALYAADRATGATLPGWPIMVTDPSAPAAGSFAGSRVAVSSPALLGSLIAFQARFEYDMKPDVDGAQGLHVLREVLVAVDPRAAAVAWQRPSGQRDITSINEVPELNLSPTPAAFSSAAGPLVAVTSSVSPIVRVFDAAGTELWTAPLSGATRSSPVLSNGLLLVATDAGVVHAFESVVNRAPLAPAAGFAPAEGELVDSAAPTLRWAAAGDDGDAAALHYEVRVGAQGGQLLTSWLAAISTDGLPQAAVPHGVLQAGAAYAYAVRARDASGAWSPWSAPQGFVVAITPKIGVAGTSYDTLDEALAAAAAGSVVTLGPGLLHLRAPARLPAGVSLAGSGAHETILDGKGLPAGIQAVAGGRTGQSEIRGLTVTGAEVGVQVVDAQDVVLRNVILRDDTRAGVEVQAGASASVLNATFARNGAAAIAHGALSVRNSIVTENDSGFVSEGAGTLASRYNDLYANRAGNYVGAQAGTGDISAVVVFAAAGRQDFRLHGAQPTTDRGDPADDFAAEPAPNGGRVNMGAFAGTTAAEISAATSGGWSTADEPSGGAAGGCAVGGQPHGWSGWPMLGLIVLAMRRRSKRRVD